MMELKPILNQIYPLHRTLASAGTDEALKIVGDHFPAAGNYHIENFAPGAPVWTWKVPERYEIEEAYLETEDGERIVDFADNPLHVVSYSLPIDEMLSWQELEPHLYSSSKRPWAIPWEFKFYERDWGFCLPKEKMDRLSRDIKYHAVIRPRFITEPDQGLRVATGVINPKGGIASGVGEILVSSHICHPMQANDDAAGVVTAIGVAHRLLRNPLPKDSMSVRFWFGPETIGTIAYLAHHEDMIPDWKGGIFIEMTGNDNTIALQRTRQDNHLMDRIARKVLEKTSKEFREGEFAQVVANDERVINGPGVNIPCISISRWPYDEYHTSDDNPDIIHEQKLQDAADVIEEIIRIYATNYRPRRKFRGPLFLSGHGLWVDWRVNKPLNKALEKIYNSFEGDETVFDIAEKTGLDYWETREYIEKFREKGLIQALPIESTAPEF